MSTLILRDGQQYGPYTDTELAEFLRSGQLSPNDLAWRDGMADWQPLGGLIGGRSSPPPPLPPKKAPSTGPAQEEKKPRGTGRFRSWAITIVISLLIFAALTNQKNRNDSSGLEDNGVGSSASSSRGPMPLTQGNAQTFQEGIVRVAMEPVQSALHSMVDPNKSLTETSKPVVRSTDDLDTIKMAKAVIEKMGYDFNLTIAEIARNRTSLLASNDPFQSSKPLVALAENTAKVRDRALGVGLINRQTFDALGPVVIDLGASARENSK